MLVFGGLLNDWLGVGLVFARDDWDYYFTLKDKDHWLYESKASSSRFWVY